MPCKTVNLSPRLYQQGYGTLYEYDGQGRQIKATDPECQLASAPHTALTSYDGLGRATLVTDARGVATAMAYDDGGNVLTVTTGGITVQSNTYDLLGNLLASADGNGNSTYYAYDALGRLSQVTNALGEATSYAYDGCGNMTAKLELKGGTAYDYDAFGNLIEEFLNDTNPFRYCGEYLDLETNTYYLRARYYQPTTGRFLSEDPYWNVGNMIYGSDPVRWNERPADPNDPLKLSNVGEEYKYRFHLQHH